MDSLNVYTLSLRNKRNCRTSFSTSKRINISCIIAVRIGRQVEVRFYGMMLLPAKCLRSPGRRENLCERRFGESFKGPIIPSGTLVEYLPKLQGRQSENSSIWNESITWIFFVRSASIAGEIWKGDILIADIEELEKLDASEIHPRRLNAQEVLITPKRLRICISCGRWFSKIIREKLRIAKTHSETGIQAMEKSFNLQKQQLTRKHGKTSGLFKEISYILIKLNREFNFSCQEKIHSLYH